MDVLTRHVDEFRRDETLSPMVREAAKRGRKILDKYYSRTDETIVFRIAMGTSCVSISARMSNCNISLASGAQDPVLS